MALDTSALMAVLLGEPEAAACAAVLGSDARLLVSAGTLAEALVVAGNRGVAAEMATLVPHVPMLVQLPDILVTFLRVPDYLEAPEDDPRALK